MLVHRGVPRPEAMARATLPTLEKIIRSTGFYKQKAKSLKGTATGILTRFGGEIPKTIAELTTLPGVARKTANVVLGTAYGIASGVVVDTHVSRIAARLDLTKNTDPVKIEQDLIKIVPQDRWILFSHQVILHGRALCMARTPECGRCDLNSLCYAKDKRA